MISAAPTHARIDTGAAVGVGLGSFALGTGGRGRGKPVLQSLLLPLRLCLPATRLLSPARLPGAAELLGPILPALLRLLIYNYNPADLRSAETSISSISITRAAQGAARFD